MTPAMQRLVDDLVSAIPGAIRSDLQSRLFNIVKEFCEFTNVWYEDIDVPLVLNTTVYTLTPAEVPAGQLVRLLVLYNSADVRLPDLYWADRARFILPTALQIYTTPTQTATWVARMAKTVADVDADNNPDVPDWIIQRYRDPLIDGVKREMYLDPNKQWSDPKMGLLYGQKFLAAKTTARVDGIKGNVAGQTNWAYPSSFGRGSQRGV